MSQIKLSHDQLKLISVFESKTRVQARDCIEDEKFNRVIFVVAEGKAGAAIGKNGARIKAVQHAIGKDVEIVEYHDDPAKFLTNILRPNLVSNVKINNQENGSKSAIVMTDPNNKALVIGRQGRNVSKARLLAQRYFGISYLTIEGVGSSPQEVL